MVSEYAVNEVITSNSRRSSARSIMRNNGRIARRIARRANWLLPEAARSKAPIAAGRRWHRPMSKAAGGASVSAKPKK